jgi:hypothetical protein
MAGKGMKVCRQWFSSWAAVDNALLYLGKELDASISHYLSDI